MLLYNIIIFHILQTELCWSMSTFYFFIFYPNKMLSFQSFLSRSYSHFSYFYMKKISFSNDSVGRKRFFEHTYLILLEAAVNRYILSDNIANELILTRDFLTVPKGREPNYRMENPDSSMIGISSSSSCCTSIKPLGTRRASFACSTALTSPCS